MKKALKVIGIVLLALLFVATFVLYAIFPTQTKDTLTNIWSTLNTPLPIVGITSIALFVFIWNVVVFIRKNQPLKELAELKREHQEYKQESEKEKQELKEQNKQLVNYLYDICELSTNQKIKNYGKEHFGYGKDANSETKAD